MPSRARVEGLREVQLPAWHVRVARSVGPRSVVCVLAPATRRGENAAGRQGWCIRSIYMSALPEWSHDYEAEVTDPRTPEARLIVIVRDTALPFAVREAAVNHPNMTRRSVLNLVNEPGQVATDVLTLTDDSDVLDYYSEHGNERFRAIIAFNPSTPGQAVEDLARDRSPLVRLNAGMNPMLSTHTRTRLALHDFDPSVRRQLWWAMTTVEGRAGLDGDRTAMISDSEETVDSDIKQFHVVLYHLDDNVALLS
jgi:hypothetical protein